MTRSEALIKAQQKYMSKPEVYERHLKKNCEIFNKRYATDEEFRERKKEQNKMYQRKRRAKLKEEKEKLQKELELNTEVNIENCENGKILHIKIHI
tara:strand:+ start:1234 stop:1521 length:288 start_codon:yes stop_codon:yes gene_type:complete